MSETIPDEIQSLTTIIAAAPCWSTYTTAQIFWRQALPTDVPTDKPIAVLSLKGGRTFSIILLAVPGALDEGSLLTLAQTLAFQIQSLYRVNRDGLEIVKEPSVGEIGEPSDWMKTAGDTANAIEITGPYGISTD